MLRIQPISIKEAGADTYLVKFQRLSSDHEQCGVGEYELPDGLVEYPFKFTTEGGTFRCGPNFPDKYIFDTAGDGTGSQWLRFAVAFFDKARREGIEMDNGARLRPIEVSLGVLNEDSSQTYNVSFEHDHSKVNGHFLVSGHDEKLDISWNGKTYTAKKGLRWTTDDMESADSVLACAVAMLHAARNFIYGPDKYPDA